MTRKQSSEIYPVDTICILCWGLIGDVFIRVPVIELLKKNYPDAKITCVVDPVGVQVLQNHPDIDNVFIFSRNKSNKFSYIKQTIINIFKLRRKKFDLSVNLYSGGSSPLISKLIAAKIRLGFDHSRSLRAANTISAVHPSFCQHWSVALSNILWPLGIDATLIRQGTSFYTSKEAMNDATETIKGRKCIAFNLGAGQNDKQWPVASYVELARFIHQEYGLIPLIISNPGMEQLTRSFSKIAGVEFEYEILPMMNLDKLGAILKQSIALITGDTSIMHMAFGVKCPTLVLFTYTRPEIVEPEDCLHVSCFIENKNTLNSCGKPPGTISMSVDYIISRFALLYDKLSLDTNR